MKIHEEMLCYGKRCCPTVAKFEDGSMTISDDDTENGSVGHIKLSAEQVARLVEIAKKER